MVRDSNELDMKKKVILSIVALSLGLGFTSGWFARRSWYLAQNRPPPIYLVRENNSSYPLIQPLLTFDYSDRVVFREFDPLRGKVAEIVDVKLANKNAEKISVYFRDLNNGHWIGINENEQYSPASLLKVPVMIAYLKEAESEPEILHKQITYQKDETADVEQNQTSHPLIPGEQYTIEELIANMIIYSDNSSLVLLTKEIDAKSLGEVFGDMGIVSPNDSLPGQYLISAKTYSLFFRVLRNATILNRDMSEKALDLLSKTTFKDGLVAGVPEGLTVAHKFGLHAIKDGQNAVGIELHDCGIVYLQSSNYLLCVMTKGTQLADLKNVIKDISALVYKELNK